MIGALILITLGSQHMNSHFLTLLIRNSNHGVIATMSIMTSIVFTCIVFFNLISIQFKSLLQVVTVVKIHIYPYKVETVQTFTVMSSIYV